MPGASNSSKAINRADYDFGFLAFAPHDNATPDGYVVGLQLIKSLRIAFPSLGLQDAYRMAEDWGSVGLADDDTSLGALLLRHGINDTADNRDKARRARVSSVWPGPSDTDIAGWRILFGDVKPAALVRGLLVAFELQERGLDAKDMAVEWADGGFAMDDGAVGQLLRRWKLRNTPAAREKARRALRAARPGSLPTVG